MTEKAVRKIASDSSTVEEFCLRANASGVDTYSRPGECCVDFAVDTTSRATSARQAEDQFGKTHYIHCFNKDAKISDSHKV